MKILDYGDKANEAKPKVIGCVECNAKFEFDPGEILPDRCPVCGAYTTTSFYNVDGLAGTTKHTSVEKAFPELYSFYNIDQSTMDTDEIHDRIRSAVKHYYNSDGGYVFTEGRGVFVAIFQQDPDDKDDYAVYVTNSYATVDSWELEG